jgi:hypothetical protein
MRERTQSQDRVALTEALGDVVIATTELQNRLLRGAVTQEILAVAHDDKLQRDLRREAVSLDVERALVKFDKAIGKSLAARRRCLATAAHPSLALQQRARPTNGIPSRTADRKVPARVLHFVFRKPDRSEQSPALAKVGGSESWNGS